MITVDEKIFLQKFCADIIIKQTQLIIELKLVRCVCLWDKNKAKPLIEAAEKWLTLQNFVVNHCDSNFYQGLIWIENANLLQVSK